MCPFTFFISFHSVFFFFFQCFLVPCYVDTPSLTGRVSFQGGLETRISLLAKIVSLPAITLETLSAIDTPLHPLFPRGPNTSIQTVLHTVTLWMGAAAHWTTDIS